MMYKWYNTKFGKEELLMFDLTGRVVVVSGASLDLKHLQQNLLNTESHVTVSAQDILLQMNLLM